jgi:hypothetical protein
VFEPNLTSLAPQSCHWQRGKLDKVAGFATAILLSGNDLNRQRDRVRTDLSRRKSCGPRPIYAARRALA